MDIYAIEAGCWPWVSRRRAGNAIREIIREVKGQHDTEMAMRMDYAEILRWRQCEEIARLKARIAELEGS
jgi:hypothetical protein